MTKTAAAVESVAKTERTFTIAGTSTTPEGIRTYRVANGKVNLRVNMLKHCGHTDIDLATLPKPMTQLQAIAFLVQKGVVDAVVATRAKDKTRETPVLVEAKKLANKRMRDNLRKRTAKGGEQIAA